MPIFAARIALGDPESDIITLGMKVRKPRPTPNTQMPVRERMETPVLPAEEGVVELLLA